MTAADHTLTAALYPALNHKERQRLRLLFSNPIFARHNGLSHEEHLRLTREQLRYTLRELPPGSDLLRNPAYLFNALAYAALVSPSLFAALQIHYCLAIGALTELGAGRADLLAPMADLESGRTLGAFLLTEAGVGASHVAVRTTAHYDPESETFDLHTPDPSARKIPVGNVGLAGDSPVLGIVYAQLIVRGTERGTFPFLVPLVHAHGPHPGVEIHALPPTLACPLDYSIVSFDHVGLPLDSLLRDSAELNTNGDFHDPLLTPDQRLVRSVKPAQLLWGAAIPALAAVSRASADIAIRHSNSRITMGRMGAGLPMMRYRTQQRALLTALAEAYTSTFLSNRAVETQIRLSLPATDKTPASPSQVVWAPWPQLGMALAIIKAAIAETAERVTVECRLRCGSNGLYTANRFVEYQGLAQVFQHAGGDDLLIKLETARAMVAQEQYAPPEDDPATGTDLTCPHMWEALSRARERRLQAALTSAVTTSAAAVQEPLAVWNTHLDLAVEAAGAYADRLTAECLKDCLAALDTTPLHEPMRLLLALPVIDRLAAHSSWYITEGLLTTEQVLSLPDIRTDLIQRLLPKLALLTDALEVPHELTAAPLSEADHSEALLRASAPAWGTGTDAARVPPRTPKGA